MDAGSPFTPADAMAGSGRREWPKAGSADTVIDEPSHHALVLSLLDATGSRGVDVIETHMSWVFLLPDRVYKLKKPVRQVFLDFTSLAAREHFCREEVRLNARLAPQVYLGVTALWRAGGSAALVDDAPAGGTPAIVDWLVRMRRLPRERMLDAAMARGDVLPTEVDAVADVLSGFFAGARPIGIAPAQMADRMRHELDLDRAVLLHPGWPVPGAAHALDRLHHALTAHGACLAERAAAGRIVDGHGDLRPEHICLLTPPMVIDCLEFSPALRQLDPFEELAYLAMECRRAGAAWVGERVLERCASALDDHPAPAVLLLYTARCALLRARLSLAHLFDDVPRTPDRWPAQAQRYVEIAHRALDRLEAIKAPPDGARAGPG